MRLAGARAGHLAGSRAGALAAALAVAMLLAGCAASGPSAVPTPTGPSPTPAATPSASTSTVPPTAPPTASPTATATPDATPAGSPGSSDAPPTDAAFWASVRSGLDAAGRLTLVLASESSPVELFFLPGASAARVGGSFVSLCERDRSYAGDASGLAPVPGTWRCGFDAFVDGLRASGRPNDAWSIDFPPESFGTVRVRGEPGGTWSWTLDQAMGPEGPATTRLELDPVSGRLVGGRLDDESGRTTFRLDYASPLPRFPRP